MSETFHFTVNDGPKKTITVKTGVYVEAVAAIPAVKGLSNYPLRIKIWVRHLLPHYGPYLYRIEHAGGPVMVVTELTEEQAQRYRDHGLGHLLNDD